MSKLDTIDKEKSVRMLEEDLNEISEKKVDEIYHYLKKSYKNDYVEINKLDKPIPVYKAKPYYRRQSPVDLQIREELPNRTVYSGSTIQEWSIDGLSEYQVIRVIKNMLMYATTIKFQGNSDKQATLAIIAGFVGQLQG